METAADLCPVCHQIILPGYYFCPNCGKSLKEAPFVISVLAQAGLYTFAVLLPPLGLWPGFKYLKKNNTQAKQVGAIMIALTLIAGVLMIWGIFGIFNAYLEQMNSMLIGL